MTIVKMKCMPSLKMVSVGKRENPDKIIVNARDLDDSDVFGHIYVPGKIIT